MWRLLTPDARSETTPQEFAAAYAEAMRTATGTRVEIGDLREEGDGVGMDVEVQTRIFGTVEHGMHLPIEDGRIDWSPHLVFPGLTSGETLARETTAPAAGEDPRARRQHAGRGPGVGADLAARHRRAPRSPACWPRPRPRTSATRSTRADSRRHARSASPGSSASSRSRSRASPAGGFAPARACSRRREPQAAEAVRTTIDVGVQEAVATALAGRFGGIAALDARTAAIRGLAGIAFSAPQPPGSTFKIITATAALEEKLVKPSDEFPVQTAAIIDGVELENANGESCGGSFADSFAHSCNSVFAPLGVKIGADKLVETAERYGFNADPAIAGRGAEHAARPRTTSRRRSSSARPRSARAGCSRRRC